ncbi:MAG: FCD domain-containing protein, partial [Candidatus Dormibacteria bacterium]
AAMRADHEFHHTVVKLSQHQRLQDMYHRIESQSRLFMQLSDVFHPGLLDVIPPHQRLAEAIMSGDTALAERLGSDHNTLDGKALMSRLESST